MELLKYENIWNIFHLSNMFLPFQPQVRWTILSMLKLTFSTLLDYVYMFFFEQNLFGWYTNTFTCYFIWVEAQVILNVGRLPRCCQK